MNKLNGTVNSINMNAVNAGNASNANTAADTAINKIIIRDPDGFARQTYDLIIVGGGIYGVMLSYEAARKGLKSLLLERDDFGGATTFNCLRILHGGFRYLQTMDFNRFRESVAERKWFLKTFPDLVSPLPCLMPLYGNGLRRPTIMKFGASINDFLSRDRNLGVKAENTIPSSRILDVAEVIRIFPGVDRTGLKGGILWYDAIMPDPQFILMEILKRSVQYGCTALNYMEAKTLVTENSQATGITAQDTLTAKEFVFKANVVVNAAGPWCRRFASLIDKDYPKLFKSSLAWNVLFDMPALSSHALAITPNKPKARTYFLVPWKNKLLAGTGHGPWAGTAEHPSPTEEMQDCFLSDLKSAIPDAGFTRNKILHLFSGLLPATREGGVGLTKRAVILDHSQSGGPHGFYSLSGIKFTTARLVAEKMLKKIFPDSHDRCDSSFEVCETSANGWYIDRNFKSGLKEPIDDRDLETLKEIVETEAVVTVDDLLFRRTNLWEFVDYDMNIRENLQRFLSSTKSGRNAN
jgi:glycerol-3-phosphate dehydrogenase